jgi:hypothetical protein
MMPRAVKEKPPQMVGCDEPNSMARGMHPLPNSAPSAPPFGLRFGFWVLGFGFWVLGFEI